MGLAYSGLGTLICVTPYKSPDRKDIELHAPFNVTHRLLSSVHESPISELGFYVEKPSKT